MVGHWTGADLITDDFFLNWLASLEVTGQNIASVAEKLAQAAAGYQNTDNSCVPRVTDESPDGLYS